VVPGGTWRKQILEEHHKLQGHVGTTKMKLALCKIILLVWDVSRRVKLGKILQGVQKTSAGQLKSASGTRGGLILQSAGFYRFKRTAG
jgi:hypothetical protein